MIAQSPRCLLVDPALPFCSSVAGKSFVVPNHLNQTSTDQIQALLKDRAWLLTSNWHRHLEKFFCLLLLPKYGSPMTVLPCRSFCEDLRDSCWMLLDGDASPWSASDSQKRTTMAIGSCRFLIAKVTAGLNEYRFGH